ncbi:NUDIX hydrolase [Streptomyces sp. NPDC101227]|uniref:NUDIX hydrolase n=1 Tax=Streptomyces sp. NPDC101227 TaxID=3366136 RepID=UPI0038159CF2
MRTPRQAARVAVLDPDGAIFLFRYDNEEVGVHWAMPGGGLDPGEGPRAGALRELREETGWSDLEPGPLLCTWEHDFTRPEALEGGPVGVPVRQHEHIYLARGPRREPADGVAAAHAADKILHGRWWTPAELADSPDPLWPPQLPALLAAVRDTPPGSAPAPVHLGYVPNEAPPHPEELWSHGATLAAWAAERPLPVHNYRVDDTGLHSADVGNGWWSLTWVEGGRAVLRGLDLDYSESIGQVPPVDLLAGGPSWLPWERLAAQTDRGEGLGFLYWWADGAWGRAPYPYTVREDGLRSMLPDGDDEVRAVLTALREDGVDAAEVRRMGTPEARAAAAHGVARPRLPAGHGEPADRRVPCDLPEQYAGVIAVAMRAAVELPRATPAAGAALERLTSWLRAGHPSDGDGRRVLTAAFADGTDAGNQYRRDGFHDERGLRLADELCVLLDDLRRADAAGDAEAGRWLYLRVQITGDADAVTVDRAHDHLPGWWGARYGTAEARPDTLAREMASRAPRWRPDWARLLDEDIPRNGAPAALCRPASAPPPAPSPAVPAARPCGPSHSPSSGTPR